MIKRGAGFGAWIVVFGTMAALGVAMFVVWRSIQGSGVATVPRRMTSGHVESNNGATDTDDEGEQLDPAMRRELEDLLKQKGKHR